MLASGARGPPKQTTWVKRAMPLHNPLLLHPVSYKVTSWPAVPWQQIPESVCQQSAQKEAIDLCLPIPRTTAQLWGISNCGCGFSRNTSQTSHPHILVVGKSRIQTENNFYVSYLVLLHSPRGINPKMCFADEGPGEREAGGWKQTVGHELRAFQDLKYPDCDLERRYRSHVHWLM